MKPLNQYLLIRVLFYILSFSILSFPFGLWILFQGLNTIYTILLYGGVGFGLMVFIYIWKNFKSTAQPCILYLTIFVLINSVLLEIGNHLCLSALNKPDVSPSALNLPINETQCNIPVNESLSSLQFPKLNLKLKIDPSSTPNLNWTIEGTTRQGAKNLLHKINLSFTIDDPKIIHNEVIKEADGKTYNSIMVVYNYKITYTCKNIIFTRKSTWSKSGACFFHIEQTDSPPVSTSAHAPKT